MDGVGSDVLDVNVYLLADLHVLQGIKRYVLCVCTYVPMYVSTYVRTCTAMYICRYCCRNIGCQ